MVYAAAMPSLEQLLPLLTAEPDDSFLRYAVAMEYARLGKDDEALGEFAELMRRHPDYVPAYFMGGRTAETKGDIEKAKELYKAGIVVAQRVGDTHAAGEISSALMMLE